MQRPVRVVGIVALAAALGAAVVLTAKLLLLLFSAVLLAVLLRGLSDLLHRKTRLRPGLALLVVVLVLGGLLGIGGWLVGPGLERQLEQLQADLPRLVSTIEEQLRRSGLGRQLLSQLRRQQGQVLTRVSELLSVSLSGGVYLLVLMITGLYLAADPDLYVNGMVRLAPVPHRARARQVSEAMAQTLRRFLLGRAVSMVAVGILTWAGLALLNVRLAGLLGVVAGLSTFVPYVGPFVAGFPIALLAVVQGPSTLVLALVYYSVVQWLEGFLITPLVQQRAVFMPPALTLAAQVLLGALFGAIGVALAVPLAACVLVLVQMLYVEGLLGDRQEERAAP